MQTLAVEIDPPATGAGGRSVSPRNTETLSTGMPSRLGGRLRNDRIKAIADLVAGRLDQRAAV